MEKLRASFTATAFFIILAGPGILSCSGNGHDPAEDLIARGKGEIADADFDSAIDTFRSILAQHDPEHGPAMWGLVLATMLKALEDFGGELRDFTDLFTQIFSPQAVDPPWPDEFKPFEHFIEAIDEVLPLLETLRENPDVEFTLPSCPFQVEVGSYFSYSIDIGGEYDQGEVAFTSALLKFVKSLAYLFWATDTELNPAARAVVNNVVIPLLTGEGEDPYSRDELFEALAYALSASPEALTLESAQGKERMAAAADLMVETVDDLLALFEIISREGDDQSDDILAFEEMVGKEYMILQYRDEGDNPSRIRLEIKAASLNGLERIRSSYAASGGVRANLYHDITPILAVIMYLILQSDIPDLFLEIYFPVIENYLSPATARLISDSIPALVDLAASDETLVGALNLITPDVIELDFGKLYRDPPELLFRSLLPEIHADAIAGEYRLSIEYECGDSLGPTDYWCPFSQGVTSSTHFTGTEHEIADDGIESLAPYLALQDPSLEEFVYLNLHALDPGLFPDEYAVPDLFETSYLLAAILSNFAGVMEE